MLERYCNNFSGAGLKLIELSSLSVLFLKSRASHNRTSANLKSLAWLSSHVINFRGHLKAHFPFHLNQGTKASINSILKTCYCQHARYLSTHDFKQEVPIMELPHSCQAAHNVALRPSCLVRSRFLYCRYYPANASSHYTSLCPTQTKPPLQPSTRSPTC
jgi:hypothetical protein